MYKLIIGGAALIAGAVALVYNTAKEESNKENEVTDSENQTSDVAESEVSEDTFVNTPYAESFQEEPLNVGVETSTTETDNKLEILLTTLDGISKSYTNALAGKNIATVKQFMNASDKDLLAIKGIGEKSIALIREKIEAM